MEPRVLTEGDLVKILSNNNKQLYQALNGRDRGINTTNAIVNNELSESILVIKMIRYVRGEITLEEI